MHRNPSSHDAFLLACIRQANLDALWGRETGTVDANRRSIKQLLSCWSQVDVSPTLPAIGPYPLKDTFGYAVAIAMLIKSRDKGRYADYQQYETIRKLRACFTNVHGASLAGTQELHTLGGDTPKYYMSTCVTHSLWFERFSRGCLSRMGQVVRQDMAISVPVIHALLQNLSRDWQCLLSPPARHLVASLGAFICIAFCGSFRGNEVFLTDASGLRTYLLTPPDDRLPYHVIIPLLGRFKNELGTRYHLTPLAGRTSSGIDVHLWITRLVQALTDANHLHGPAFCDALGQMASPQLYETELLDRLQTVQAQDPALIGADIIVHEAYGLSRSFRRGATSEARARGVSPDDIDLTNRWRTFEHAKGRRPRQAMRDHYSDIRLLIPALLRFSQAL
jgi:hypothetical protein